MSIRIPRMRATVERRLLINYRVDPAVATTLVPEGLRPQIVDGSAVAGVCLIRLGDFRPSWFTPRIGWGAENAAHRIAVEWDDPAAPGGVATGVYIPRRHTASRLAVLAGGRVFPGVHEIAHVTGNETPDRISVRFDARDLTVDAEVELIDVLESSLFADLDTASEFFRQGAVGWSSTRTPGEVEGLRLDTDAWRVEAARAVRVESSFFDALPAGSAQLDCVLVMREVPVVWSAPSERFRRVPQPA